MNVNLFIASEAAAGAALAAHAAEVPPVIIGDDGTLTKLLISVVAGVITPLIHECGKWLVRKIFPKKKDT